MENTESVQLSWKDRLESSTSPMGEISRSYQIVTRNDTYHLEIRPYEVVKLQKLFQSQIIWYENDSQNLDKVQKHE